MKTTAVIKFFAVAALLLTCSQQTAYAQSKGKFTGKWYSPDVYLNIDFHGKSVEDFNSMDGGQCPGMIRMRRGKGDYSIGTAVVSGNEAVATAYVFDNNVGINFKLMPDGSMKMDCLNFKYFSDDYEELTLPTSVTLRKAEPFAGEWRQDGGSAKMTLNLYFADVFNNGGYYYGLVSNADKAGDILITECKVDGNRAEVAYTVGGIGAKQNAVLTYDPSGGRLTFKPQGQAGGMTFVR